MKESRLAKITIRPAKTLFPQIHRPKALYPKPNPLNPEAPSPNSVKIESLNPEMPKALNPQPQEKKKNLVKDKIIFLERLLRTKPQP